MPLSSVSVALCLWGQFGEPTVGEPARICKKWVLGKRLPGGNPTLATDLSIGGVALMLDACGPLCEYRDALIMLAGLMSLFDELCTVH